MQSVENERFLSGFEIIDKKLKFAKFNAGNPKVAKLLIIYK